MQPIQFFDDPFESPKPRDEVRLKNLGLYVYEDGRRIAVGFDITPFLERPSIEVTIYNLRGERAGALTVIEAMEANFHLTMHLRDKEPADEYRIEAVLYYEGEDGERLEVDRKAGLIDVSLPGDQTIWEEE